MIFILLYLKRFILFVAFTVFIQYFCTKAAVNLLIPTMMLKTMMYCYTKYDCENIHVMYAFYSIIVRMCVRVCNRILLWKLPQSKIPWNINHHNLNNKRFQLNTIQNYYYRAGKMVTGCTLRCDQIKFILLMKIDELQTEHYIQFWEHL